MSSPRSPNLEKSLCSNKEPKTNKQKLKRKKKGRVIWAECSEQGFTLTSCVSLGKFISQSSFCKPQLYFLYHHMRNNIHLCLGNRKGSGSDSPDNLSLVLLKNVFIYFWLSWVGLHCCSRAFFSCGKRGLLSSCGVQASCRSGFCWCRGWALGMRASVAAALRLRFWHRDLAASGHVGSSPTRDQTYVPCIGGWILNHWTTREAPESCLDSMI